MYVIACYRITDKEEFRARTEEPLRDKLPHWRLINAVPTRDGSACYSLWSADSAEALQRVLARAAGTAGLVECYEVDEDNALGLGETPVTVIHVSPGGPEEPERGRLALTRGRRSGASVIDSLDFPRDR